MSFTLIIQSKKICKEDDISDPKLTLPVYTMITQQNKRQEHKVNENTFYNQMEILYVQGWILFY